MMAPSGIGRGSPSGKYQPRKLLAARPPPPLYLLRQPFDDPPRALERNMQLGGRARGDIDIRVRSRLAPAEMIDHGLIDAESGRYRLFDHPQQRKFRKAAFRFRIAAP